MKPSVFMSLRFVKKKHDLSPRQFNLEKGRSVESVRFIKIGPNLSHYICHCLCYFICHFICHDSLTFLSRNGQN